jgi:hypothetical protein
MSFSDKHDDLVLGCLTPIALIALLGSMLSVAGIISNVIRARLGWGSSFAWMAAFGVVVGCWSVICVVSERLVRWIAPAVTRRKRCAHRIRGGKVGGCSECLAAEKKRHAERLKDLAAAAQRVRENLSRTWTEFQPGDLTPEEEELVKREGLNRQTYTPQKVLKKHAEAEERMRKRAEIMSRPATDPERVQMEWAERVEQRVERFRRGFSDRFDGFGYGMGLLVILGFTVSIANGHGWRLGIFCCRLMVVILELSYRLYARH